MSTAVECEIKEAVPLYQRIECALRERIANGTWQAGHALPNRSRLCAEFHTTRVTLDKAIQGLIRDGLLNSAKGSGTFVASPVASPAALHFAVPSRALRLGVVLERTTLSTMPEDSWSDNFYFGPLFQGIRDGIVGEAVETLYAHLKREEYESFYRDSALDGMLLVAPLQDELPTLHELARQEIAFMAVGISSSAPEDDLLPCVDTDNMRGAADAIRHLLGLGHRRIALINLATAHANHHDRLVGCQWAMKAAGVPILPEDLVLFPTYDIAQFEDRIEKWLLKTKTSGTLPTAIFASDYLMALAALRVLRRHRLCVPEDISLVSFDDPLSAAHLTPPLTTVRQPVYRLGRRAIQRLLQALQDGACPQGLEILPTELIIRDSTRRITAGSATERALVTV
jgi:DNA-binding LacI/PurR family transcriptional regulator/DNA-binding transcriptional regulator YhcF (GntR family)